LYHGVNVAHCGVGVFAVNNNNLNFAHRVIWCIMVSSAFAEVCCRRQPPRLVKHHGARPNAGHVVHKRDEEEVRVSDVE